MENWCYSKYTVLFRHHFNHFPQENGMLILTKTTAKSASVAKAPHSQRNWT